VAADARFCDGCGASLTAAAPAVRKTVTAVFCDLGGSTGFGERVDAETARTVIGRYHAMLQEVVDAHAGTVAKFIGDGMLAFFGIPEVAEDDAERAVAAGAEMQRRFRPFADEVEARHGERLLLRIGVNSGEVVIGEGDADVVGDALNVASRLEKACEPGRVLVGEGTWRLTRATFGFEPLGEVGVAGRAEPVAAFVLVDGERPTEEATPFVGRDRELGRLRSALSDATAARAARFVAVVGPPGVGKTRLARELELAVDGQAQVLHTACERAGASTFGPLVELIRPAIGDDPSREALAALVPPGDAERDRVVDGLAGVVGLGEARSTEETFWSIRRMVELLAADQPLVLVIDDIQWAEARLLDLLEHLAEWTAAAVLLVGLARPELRELRPALAEPGRRVADVVVLDGLDAGATEQLASRMLGGALPSELVARLPDSTDGNPLFVRELVRMLVDEGVLRREGDEWRLTVDADAVEVPPTIRSLLAARIERLPAAERAVLERASVVGPDFVLGALRHLVDEPARLDGRLEALRRRDLVEPTGTYWGDDPVWRFHHVLIRDAVYGRLLKETRAELHERVGDWTVAAAPHVVGEHETTIAHHYEQAHGYRSQLGALDDRGRELGRRAAGLLGTAARQALAADDLVAAGALAVRALACLGDADGTDLLLLALEALLASGEPAEVPRLLDALDDAAWADVYRAQWLDLTDPGRLDEAERLADGAAGAFEERGDRSGQAKAHLVRAGLLARRGRLADSEAELDRAMGAAREAGDVRRLVAAMGAAPAVALWGPSPVARAGGRCLDVIRLLRITTASPVVEATSLRHQAVLEALRGRTGPARRLLAEVRATVEELGLRRDLMEVELFEGIVDLLDGEPVAAESHLRTAHDGLATLGAAAAGAAVWLARALLAQGRVDDAEALGVTASDQDLKTAIAWRSVGAELLAARGEHAAAVTLAEEAVALAAPTDFLLDHADALATLAAVRRAAGDAAGAAEADADAARRYAAKGSTVHLAAPIERSPSPTTPEVADNAAARQSRSVVERWMADGPDAAADGHAPDARLVDHRAGLAVEVVGREAIVAHLRTITDVINTARIEQRETVATRGDRVALVRQAATGGLSGFEVEVFVLVELDEDGRQALVDWYDVDDLPAALAELDARHVAVVAENRAARHNRALMARWMSDGPDAVADFYATNVVSIDRRVGLRMETVTREEMVEQLRVISGLLGDRRAEIVEVVAQRGDHLALTREAVLADVEVEQLVLVELDDDGRVGRTTSFDVDDLPAAMVELEERHRVLTSDATAMAFLDARHAELSERGPENLAARRTREATRRWMVEGPDVAIDAWAPDACLVDRRVGFGNEVVGRDAVLAQLRTVTELLGDHSTYEVGELVAQRGEHLVLFRQRVTGDIEVEQLSLTEVDAAGCQVRATLFDAEALDAATTELDRRHTELSGENLAASSARTFIRRWMDDGPDAVRDLVAEDFREVDHRAGSGGIAVDREALLEGLRATDELRGTVEFRVIDVLAQRGDLLVLFEAGLQGAFEVRYLALAEYDRHGRRVASDMYDLDDLDVAVAELERRFAAYEQLGVGNRASDLGITLAERWMAEGADAVADLVADDIHYEDRRVGFATTYDGKEIHLANLRAVDELRGESRFETVEVVAVRGENLALAVQAIVGEADVGLLALGEFDDAGRQRAVIVFDFDDRDAAIAELDRRFAAQHATVENLAVANTREVLRRFNADDIDGIAERFDARHRLVDHRLGLRDDRDSEGVLASLRATREVAGRADYAVFRVIAQRGERLALLEQGFAAQYESRYLALIETTADGRTVAADVYDLADESTALAELDRRFTGAEPMVNRADALGQVFNERWMAEGADAVAHLVAEDIHYEDHRVGLKTSLDGRDAHLENLRATDGLLPADARVVVVDPIAHRGDGLVLCRYDLPAVAVESLNVAEFDGDGRLAFAAMFDKGDLAGAQQVLNDRYAAGEGQAFAEQIARCAAFSSAVAEGDADALAPLLTDDFSCIDHRPIGWGDRVRDTFLAAVAARPETLGRGICIQRELHLRPGLTLVRHEILTRSPSGAEAQEVGLSIARLRDGLVDHFELFAEDDRAAAEARFDELSTESDGNLAARRAREFVGRWMSDGPQAVGPLLTDGFRMVDHRAGFGDEVDSKEAFVVNLGAIDEVRGEQEMRIFRVIAERGERLVLVDQGFEGDFEVPTLDIVQVDADGLLIRVDVYEPEDLVAALAELDRRYLAGEGVDQPAVARVIAFLRDEVDSDWEAARTHFAPDFRAVDRRPMGYGEIGLEERLERDRALGELRPGVHVYVVWAETVRRVALMRIVWVDRDERDGFQRTSLAVVRVDGDDLVERIELFPEDDLGPARDRYEALVAEG
jgi:class 3 adenylate cyclase